MGKLMCILVTAANEHDSVADEQVFKRREGKCLRWKKILANGSCTGERLVLLAQAELGVKFEVVSRRDEAGFRVIPKQGIVERSIAWFSWFQRLSRDYEANMETSEAWVLLTSIVMMIKNI